MCVLDAAGKVLGEREFEHSGTGLSQMASWVLSLATGDAGEVGVAVETPRGPVVESLMERGFAVHSINPKQLDRFRDRLSPAGAKDDRRDAPRARLGAAYRPALFAAAGADRPGNRRAARVVALSEELTRERVRLANRMRDQLWRYYPQFLDAVDDDVAAPWALDLWQSLPTPRAGQRVREVTLTRVLKQHRIRRIDTATLRARLRAPAIKLTPGAAEAAVTHVRLVAERLALVNRQLEHVRRELDGLVHQLAQAAPTHDPNASTEDEPSSTKPPDAAILLSLPGIGNKVLATLLAEGNDAVRRRDYHALRCLCGVAPVTRRSGKSMIVTRRQAAHDRLRDAAYHWARVAAQRDPVSHDKYRSLRARGHGHARALRSVADRLLNVACAMLRNGACFAHGERSVRRPLPARVERRGGPAKRVDGRSPLGSAVRPVVTMTANAPWSEEPQSVEGRRYARAGTPRAGSCRRSVAVRPRRSACPRPVRLWPW